MRDRGGSAALTAQSPEEPSDHQRWAGRPLLARTVRVVVFLGPLLLSLVVTAAATRLVPAPHGTGARVLWWVALLLLSTATVWAADRLLRRLIPLAALLEMSVLFPGRAPTRFSVARQSGSTRQLEELVARARESDEHTEPVVAASRILALVGALRSHDRATRGHSERVRVLTDLIAEEMGLSPGDRDRLRWAALLHDIGKLDVPAKILNKPGKPTVREWARLKRHPAAGQELAAPLLPFLGPFAPVIIQHHERFDGLGYPAGLAGTQICLGARIVAVADAFEVMTAARSYKKAVPRAVALREMTKMAGTQFDPAVVRALLSVSAPRLRWAIGPWAWLAQLPVISSAPSLASVTSVAGQAAAGAGAVGLGTAVGLTSLAPTSASVEVAPQVLKNFRPVAPHEPSAPPSAAAATPAPTAEPSSISTLQPTGRAGTVVRPANKPGARVIPQASPAARPTAPSPTPTPTPTPTAAPTRGGRPPSPTASPSASPTASPATGPRKPKPSKSPKKP
jgi:hypothetical protein